MGFQKQLLVGQVEKERKRKGGGRALGGRCRAALVFGTCVWHRRVSAAVWQMQPVAAGPAWLVLSTSHIAERFPHIPHSCLLREVVCRALLNIKV